MHEEYECPLTTTGKFPSSVLHARCLANLRETTHAEPLARRARRPTGGAHLRCLRSSSAFLAMCSSTSSLRSCSSAASFWALRFHWPTAWRPSSRLSRASVSWGNHKTRLQSPTGKLALEAGQLNNLPAILALRATTEHAAPRHTLHPDRTNAIIGLKLGKAYYDDNVNLATVRFPSVKERENSRKQITERRFAGHKVMHLDCSRHFRGFKFRRASQCIALPFDNGKCRGR